MTCKINVIAVIIYQVLFQLLRYIFKVTFRYYNIMVQIRFD